MLEVFHPCIKLRILQQAIALDIPPVHTQLFPNFDAFFANWDTGGTHYTCLII